MCPKCLLPNTTLQWHETGAQWVCLGCYYHRRAEQTRIDQQWSKRHSSEHSEKPRV